jgi:hypothetical protein
METPLQKAVNILHGQLKTASVLTEFNKNTGNPGRRIYQSHVSKWLRETKNGLPAEYCIAIEQATNGTVTRYMLRPDVFGTIPDKTNELRQ